MLTARIWVVTFVLRFVTWFFSLFTDSFISLSSYRKFCDLCCVPFFISTEEGNIIFYNKQYAYAFFHDKLPSEKVIPEFKDAVKYQLKKASTNKIRLITASGKPELIGVEFFSVKIQELPCVGAIVKSTGEFLNMSQLGALNSVEMQELMNSDFDYILAIDRQLKHTFCSEELANLLGYTPEEITELTSTQFLDPGNKQAVMTALHKAIHSKNENFNTIIAVTNKNKTQKVFLNFHAKLFINQEGKFMGLVGVAKNVTEEMRTQISEQSKIQLLDSAIQTVSDMIDSEIDTTKSIAELFYKIAKALNVSKICLAQNIDNKSFKLVQSYENQCRCASMCECKNKRTYSACMDQETISALEANRSVVSNKNPTPLMKRFMKTNGISSLAYIPVFIHGQFWGFLTVQDCVNSRIWEGSEIATLKLIAICVGSVLSLQKKVDDSEKQNEKLSRVLELATLNVERRTALLKEENKRISEHLSTVGNK